MVNIRGKWRGDRGREKEIRGIIGFSRRGISGLLQGGRESGVLLLGFSEGTAPKLCIFHRG